MKIFYKKDLLTIFSILAGIIFVITLFPTQTFKLDIEGLNCHIDYKAKTVLVSMPKNDPGPHTIAFILPEHCSSVRLIPTYPRNSTGTPLNREILLKNGSIYNLNDLGGHNKLVLDYFHLIHTEFDLYILDSNLPIIYLTGSEIKNEALYRADVLSGEGQILLEDEIATLELRGFEFGPKRKYNIEFREKTELLGREKRDEWTLVNTWDTTTFREKLSFDLYNKISTPGEKRIAPHPDFTELFINGEYKGVYLLEEKSDRKLFGLKKYNRSDQYPTLIFKSDSWNGDFAKTYSEEYQKGQTLGESKITYYEGFQQKEPKTTSKEYLQDLAKLVLYVNHSPDSEFYSIIEGIYSKVDTQTIIDHYLLLQMTYNEDSTAKNVFWTREGVNKYPQAPLLTPQPYDFDATFGRNYYSAPRPHNQTLPMNTLYERLLKSPYFKHKVAKRWFELRSSVWSEEQIATMIENYTETLGNSIYRNYNEWYDQWLTESYLDVEKTPDEEIQYVLNWTHHRLEYLDGYFKGEFFEGALPENKTRIDQLNAEFMQEFGFLDWELETPKNITLKRGNYTVDNTLILPEHLSLLIEGGTNISLAENKSFIKFKDLIINGSEQHPVRIFAQEESRPFGSFGVYGNDFNNCTIRNLDISGGNETVVKTRYFSGSLSLYHCMNTEIINSTIRGGHSDDGANIKYSNIQIEHSTFINNFADQLDLDFCKGTVENSVFMGNNENTDGDGLDVSGSQIRAQNNTFKHCKDKGVSVGEESNITLIGNHIVENNMGVAIKDLSVTYLIRNDILGNTIGIAGYQKKEEFGGGFGFLCNNTLQDNEKDYELDDKSMLSELNEKAGVE